MRIIKYLFFVSIVLLLCLVNACKNKSDNKSISINKRFYGSWLPMNVFDSLNFNDTNSQKKIVPFLNLESSLTEIVIDDLLSDSILMIHEDLELYYLKIKYASKDTLVAFDDTKLVIDDNKKLVLISTSKPNLTFFSAPKNMLTQLYENPKIYSGFRKKFNSEFNKYSYHLIDSSTLFDDRKYVILFADGKIRGYKKYKNYYLHLYGDLNNVKDAISLTLSNDSTSEQFGLKYYADSLELYTLKSLALKYEKPYYQTENKVATFIKQKWY